MSTLAAIERHPHALAVLGSALEPGGKPSHAYLFHGPPGAGKAAAARAFAAELLAEGATNPDGVRDRAERESHPDLTWVRASGASEMRRADIDEPVVAAAARRPFESSKRVFVIEGADTMNAEAANRMLKTLEEPASYVHLVLLTDRPEQVLPTISSRCLAVRFDAPTEAQLEEQLGARGIAPEVAQACAKLALGDANRALAMALGEGAQQRANAERFARCARHNKLSDQPWMALITLAQTSAAAIEDRLNEEAKTEAESLPKKERNKYEKDAKADAHRVWRRVRTSALDEGLRLAGLWYRDLACVVDGAPDLIYAIDRRTELEADAAGLSSHRLRDAIALVDATRASLSIYPDDQLQLEALAYRLARKLS